LSLKGVLKLPFTLTLGSPGVTKTANTANVWGEIIDYQVPKGMAVAFRQGDRLYLYLATSVPAQVLGTVRLFVRDPNKVTRIQVAEADLASLDAGGTPEDLTKQWKLRAGFSRAPDQHLTFELLSASVWDPTQATNKLELTGLQVVQL